MSVDAAQKKDDEIRLIENWYLWFLFQKVLPAGHNTDRVIINTVLMIHGTLKFTIGALIMKPTIVNFKYFEISVETGSLTHILFNQRLRLFIPFRRTLVTDGIEYVCTSQCTYSSRNLKIAKNWPWLFSQLVFHFISYQDCPCFWYYNNYKL